MRQGIAVATLLLVAAVATAAPLHVDFGHWDRSEWLMVKEPPYPAIGRMVQQDGYIENEIPAGASEADVLACKAGTALMIRRGFSGRDLVARASLAFLGKGAPGLLLRTAATGTTTGALYSLILYKDGVNLWRNDGAKYRKVAASKFPVTPGEFHDLSAHLRDRSLVVHVDGVRVLAVTEPDSLPAGAVGFWLGEGVCRVKSFSLRSLDR